jgi:hypothetical protein
MYFLPMPDERVLSDERVLLNNSGTQTGTGEEGD